MQIRISTILLSLATEAIWAVVFFSLIPADVIPADIRWLDFAVMTAINIVYVLNILFPFVNFADKSHKEVSALGIRWSSTGLYTAIAFLFLLANILYAWRNSSPAMGFGLQATVQAALLLLFIGGVVASKASMEKAKEVHEKEMIMKRGKADIKAAVGAVLAAAEGAPGVPRELTDRLRRIASATRYISPSASADSMLADKKIIEDCDRLRAYFADYGMNKDQIADCVTKLDRDLRARKAL